MSINELLLHTNESSYFIIFLGRTDNSSLNRSIKLRTIPNPRAVVNGSENKREEAAWPPVQVPP